MDLLKTSFLTGISTGIRLLTSFAVNKVVAVVAGPAGLAMIGQVQNVATLVQGASGGLVGSAVVKYSADWKNTPQKLNNFLAASYLVMQCTAGVLGVLVALSSWFLARSLLGDTSYWWIFFLLGCTLPLNTLSVFIGSVINGYGDFRKLTKINILQSLLGLAVSIALSVAFGLPGALIAAVLAPFVAVIILTSEFKNHKWIVSCWPEKIETWKLVRSLGPYAAMALTSAVCGPVAQVLVRSWIVERCSLDEAGYWQAIVRFSGAYLAFFTATLSIYFLPKFSSLNDQQIIPELRRAYQLLLPILGGLFVVIWWARNWLVPLMFTNEFQPIVEILKYQLIGDLLKIGGWLIGFIMLAKKQLSIYIWSEIASALLYYVLVLLLVGSDGSGGVRGALIAWIVLYGSYWAFMAIALKRVFGHKIAT